MAIGADKYSMAGWFNFDPFVDVQGLTSLHEEICKGIAKSSWGMSGVGPNRLHKDVPDVHEAIRAPAWRDWKATQQQKEIAASIHTGCLSLGFTIGLRLRHKPGLPSTKSDPANLWDTPNKKHFPGLLDWIAALPIFTRTGRIIIWLNPPGFASEPHKDYTIDTGNQDQFLHCRPILNKPLYQMDDAGEKTYLDAHCCWFDTMTFHAVDASPTFSYSIRIDGEYTDEIKIWVSKTSGMDTL
jgi:hypothetical protein